MECFENRQLYFASRLNEAMKVSFPRFCPTFPPGTKHNTSSFSVHADILCLRVKERRRRWWPGSSFLAVKSTWSRSEQSSRSISRGRCTRPSLWVLQYPTHTEGIEHTTERACLCLLPMDNFVCAFVFRSTLKETTRKLCSVCAEETTETTFPRGPQGLQPSDEILHGAQINPLRLKLSFCC